MITELGPVRAAGAKLYGRGSHQTQNKRLLLQNIVNTYGGYVGDKC